MVLSLTKENLNIEGNAARSLIKKTTGALIIVTILGGVYLKGARSRFRSEFSPLFTAANTGVTSLDEGSPPKVQAEKRRGAVIVC